MKKLLIAVMFLAIVLLMGCEKKEVVIVPVGSDVNITDVNIDFTFVDSTGDAIWIDWPEPNLSNPTGITFIEGGRECEFAVTGPNEIEASCSFQEWLSIMYYSMTREESNDVQLKFMEVE